jgi:hypothetical protein
MVPEIKGATRLMWVQDLPARPFHGFLAARGAAAPGESIGRA